MMDKQTKEKVEQALKKVNIRQVINLLDDYESDDLYFKVFSMSMFNEIFKAYNKGFEASDVFRLTREGFNIEHPFFMIDSATFNAGGYTIFVSMTEEQVIKHFKENLIDDILEDMDLNPSKYDETMCLSFNIDIE